MPGPQEARVAAGVHVQQIARTGPLVPVRRLLADTRRTRDPLPLEHFPNGRVREARGAGDQPRSPTRLASTGTDRLLELGRQLSRRAMRTTRPIEQTRQAAPRLLTRLQPAMPPAMGRRRRDVEGGRG